MDTEGLKHLVVQLAAITERLDQRSELAVRRTEQAGAEMGAQAQRLSTSTQSFAQDVSQALQHRASEIIGRGLGTTMDEVEAQLRASARTATAAAQALEHERTMLGRERRIWLWLGGGALVLGSALAVGAAVHTASRSRDEVERNQVEAELLRAYNRADVILCDGRLCANPDERGQRYGDRKQYRPVEPR